MLYFNVYEPFYVAFFSKRKFWSCEQLLSIPIDLTGISWHPNLQTEQNLITKGDLPRFVMDSYEESRGPPRLFLLDKYEALYFFPYTPSIP